MPVPSALSLPVVSFREMLGRVLHPGATCSIQEVRVTNSIPTPRSSTTTFLKSSISCHKLSRTWITIESIQRRLEVPSIWIYKVYSL